MKALVVIILVLGLACSAYGDCCCKSDEPVYLITFVLDETGSMQSQKDTVIEQFNKYICDLKTKKQKILFTLTTFNTERIRTPLQSVDAESIPMLDADTYRPAEATPLYDAVIDTIHIVEKSIICKDNYKILFIVLTDGLENSSTKYSQRDVIDILKSKKQEGWEFVYLGVHPDAWNREEFSSVNYQINTTDCLNVSTSLSNATNIYLGN